MRLQFTCSWGFKKPNGVCVTTLPVVLSSFNANIIRYYATNATKYTIKGLNFMSNVA